jgi:UDP-N-acetylglucosamine 2-epimerase (non-hydrolysing)
MDVVAPRVAVCLGSRPEAVKFAPLVEALRRAGLDPQVIATSQHPAFLDEMLATFGLVPDVTLDLARPGASLAAMSARAIAAFEELFGERRPAAVLVQGDTTIAMNAALAAFYAGVPVGHVDAGLRTTNRRSPFPDEINRRLVSELATWHFCPTAPAAENLRRENIDTTAIEVTGNTVIDSLRWMIERQRRDGHVPPGLPAKRAARRIVVTVCGTALEHDTQLHLCHALADVTLGHRDTEVVLATGLSPAVHASFAPDLDDLPDLHLTGPVGYHDFVHLLGTADLVVTDSGAAEEGAPSLDVPVLVMRDSTERPEGVAAGCARLCGTDPAAVHAAIDRLLTDPIAYEAMASAPSPYGDGLAARRIAARLAADLGVARRRFIRPWLETTPGEHATAV